MDNLGELMLTLLPNKRPGTGPGYGGNRLSK